MVKKELSNEQRERIIGAYLSGTKQKVISAQLSIAPSTVNDTIKRYKQTHSATPKKRPGRPKTLTDRDVRVLKRIVREDRFGSLPVLTGKLNSDLETTLHTNTSEIFMYATIKAVVYHGEFVSMVNKFENCQRRLENTKISYLFQTRDKKSGDLW